MKRLRCHPGPLAGSSRPRRAPAALAIGYAVLAAVGAAPTGSALAEGVSAAREGAPATARLEFRLTVPHSLSLHVAPIEKVSEVLDPALHAALATVQNPRLNRVTVASNAGPVTITESSQAAIGDPGVRAGVLSTGPILSSAYGNSDPADPAARPPVRRARVTRHNAIWIHLQSRPPAPMPAGGDGRHAVRAPYIAAAP